MRHPNSFRYPVVRRRNGESTDAYYQRRAETRGAAIRAWRERTLQQQQQEREFGPRTFEHAFDSWGDFVSRAESAESAPALGRTSRDVRDDESWSGTATFEDAAKLARYGWPDGAEQLANLTAQLTGRLANASHSKRMGFDVMGPGTLDVGRWAIGHPECMMVWRESDELTDLNPARVVRLTVSGFQAGVTPHHQIFWRGAAAFAICDLIESSGARCEVELVFTSSGSGAVSTQRVMLKRAQDAVDPDMLAFAFCHPSSFRRIGFGVAETFETAERKTMGFSQHGYYGMRREMEPREYGDAVYIPANCAPFDTAEQTAAWVVEKLREHEIEVEKL